MHDDHSKSQLNYYDNNSSEYEKQGFLHRGLTRAYRRKALIINQRLQAIQARRIIEIGAGSGLMTYFLAQMFSGEYVALDLSSEMLKVAQQRVRRPGVEFVLGDGVKPEFPPQSFDAVIGVDIIHHLDAPIEAFRNWKNLVRPGGKMVFLETNTYNPLNLRNIGVEHEVRSFLNTDKNLFRWSQEASWEVVSVEPAPSFTPSGPEVLVPLFNMIDTFSVKIPLWRKLAALWLIDNTRGDEVI